MRYIADFADDIGESLPPSVRPEWRRRRCIEGPVPSGASVIVSRDLRWGLDTPHLRAALGMNGLWGFLLIRHSAGTGGEAFLSIQPSAWTGCGVFLAMRQIASFADDIGDS